MYASIAGLGVTFLVTLAGYFCLVTDNPAALVRKMNKGHCSGNFRLFLLLILTILGVNLLELLMENSFRFVTWDMTPYIHALEGDLTAWLQQRLPAGDTLTNVLTFMYVFAFPAIIWVSLAYYNFRDDSRRMSAVLLAVLFNYLIAFPFYLFFPVSEAWYHSSRVQPLMHQVYPGFEAGYRAFSGLNNCFPSLHTSLSLTMAFLATLSPYKRLARVLQVSAGLIILATLYLGIHWLTDVIGGVFTAGLAVPLALTRERAAGMALMAKFAGNPGEEAKY